MYQKISSILASKKFFYTSVILLVLQAVWIAFSGRYPMAFDEDFHLGIIRLYAHHISPFWNGQPTGSDVFGPVFRDPSYLYHYLMSFPYRLISLLTSDTTIQVIVLRCINIALFAASLPLLRRLLLRLGASLRQAHVALALFVLVPVVPMLAGQINYDNLFIPLTVLFLLWALTVHDDIRNLRPLHAGRLGLLISLGLLTSIVKFAFLPILLSVGVFLAIQAYRYLGRRHKFWRSIGFGVSQLHPRFRWLLAALLVLSITLFTQRYALNLIDYHTPIPSCDQVLSVERCKAYGPWNRDYNFAQLNNDQHDNIVAYSADWLYGMWLRTFFAVDGPATNFETRGPLVVPAMAAIVFSGVGLLAFLASSRRIFREHDSAQLTLILLALGGYIGALWLDNYHAYLRTGQPVAINGRYLLFTYPLLMLLLTLGYQRLPKHFQKVQALIALLALLSFLWGGGVLTYIIRSRDAWLWPNKAVQHVNYDVRQWLTPLTPGSRDPTQYLPGS